MRLRETLFLNRNNTIRIKLYEDEVAFTTNYPSNPPTRFILKVGSITIDSNYSPSCFNWDSLNSTLEIDIASYSGLSRGTYWVELIIYSSIWSNGVVWIHPTDTPDKLQIKILD